MAKLTTEEFIKRAREVHGDKYVYSKVSYVNSNIPVTLICKKHGPFVVLPIKHIHRHRGCPQCSLEKFGPKDGYTTEGFIEVAKKIHGDRYDYSKVEYKGSKVKVCIICPEHGGFLMRPNDHITSKQGCPKCAGNYLSNTEEFIGKVRKVHGDKYDYSLVDYKNNKTVVKIICPEHGIFEQIPNSHLSGRGCPVCRRESFLSNTEGFIEKARKVHGDKYDYSLVEYKNYKSIIKIICSEHGIIETTPNYHLRGVGCVKCAGVYRPDTEEFIEKTRKIHGNKYNYSLVDYKKNKSNVKIICPEHGVFEQIPNSHLKGMGCPECGKKSLGEQAIAEILNSQNVKYEREKKFPGLRYSDKINSIPRFDFYLTDHKCCIEFQGRQHYEPIDFFGGEERLAEQQRCDKIKRDYCKRHGIKLVEIRYDENVEEILDRELIK